MEAGFRAELLVQLLNAQADIARQLAEARALGAPADVLAGIEGHGADLAAVQQRLASGTVSASVLRGEIAATVAALSGVVQQARASAAGGQVELTLERARTEARETVHDFTRAFYEDRIFDKYLAFDSPEEERAYRQREAERQRAIEAALAKGTPEGDLLAATLAREQLLDAGRYGAADSPAYRPMLDRIDQDMAALSGSIPAPAQEVRPSNHAPMADPLDDIAATAPIDPAVAAALRDAGVMATDPSLTGHGVTLCASNPSQLTPS